MIKNLLLLSGFLAVFTGCYTVLLTTANMPQRQVVIRKVPADSGKPGDSILVYDSVMTANVADTGSPAYKQRPLRLEANCTPFEINNGLCWTTCDRCGVYHRLGYEYCPRGWYYSYYGWDYYDQYPYWYNTYDRYRRDSYYDGYRRQDDGYYYGSGSGGAGAGVSTRHSDSLQFIGDRKSYRSEIVAPLQNPPSSGGKGIIIPITPPASSATTPAPLPRRETAPSQPDTGRGGLDKMMDRRRAR